MSSFLYFAESNSPITTLEQVKALGVDYAFEVGPSSTPVGAGPNGKPGQIFADVKRLSPAKFGYYPDHQEWQELPSGKAWVGWDMNKRPNPANLARRKGPPGKFVPFSDGNEWLVPALFVVSGDQGLVSVLSRRMTLNENGEWVYGDVEEKHKRLSAIGERFLEGYQAPHVEDDEKKPLTDGETAALVSELLSYNYCVSAFELSCLGVFGQDSLIEAGRAAADLDTFEAWAQKKTQESDPADSDGSQE